MEKILPKKQKGQLLPLHMNSLAVTRLEAQEAQVEAVAAVG